MGTVSMDWHSPMAAHSAIKLDPPELINGRGIPIAGRKASAIMIFTEACIPIHAATPYKTSIRKGSDARRAR
jgi:hypothetical protein